MQFVKYFWTYGAFAGSLTSLLLAEANDSSCCMQSIKLVS